VSGSFKAACIQLNAGLDMPDNLAVAADLVREARAGGADLIALPENVALMTVKGAEVRAGARAPEDHPALAAFRTLARETGAWLLAGSIGIKAEAGKVANRSYLLDNAGEIAGFYDKIHMFDVDLPSGQSFRESEGFQAGDRACVYDTPWGPIGLSICYDLRFPQLYRALAQGGASYLAVPAAFMHETGKAHWHVLLRARAIETGSYVIAPCMWGEHGGGRRTYGHSLIVDPWGEVLADGGEGVGIAMAEIDPQRVAEARAQIPALQHGRPFAMPERPGEESAA
jgi:deaminated glutathione amidase